MVNHNDFGDLVTFYPELLFDKKKKFIYPVATFVYDQTAEKELYFVFSAN